MQRCDFKKVYAVSTRAGILLVFCGGAGMPLLLAVKRGDEVRTAAASMAKAVNHTAIAVASKNIAEKCIAVPSVWRD